MMDIHLIWKAVLVVIGGTILLRFAGRKTLSETTLGETVIMISLGTLLIQPLVSDQLLQTFLVGGILILTLLALEYLQVKSNLIEKIIAGEGKVLIENGEIHEKNLLKLHMTVDQLEIYLREKSVMSLDDVEIATLESNGQISFLLKEEARPITKKDLKTLESHVYALICEQKQLFDRSQNIEKKNLATDKESQNIFKEVKKNKHDPLIPKHLQ